MNEVLIKLFESNPNLLTTLIPALLSALVVAIITNPRKAKRAEAEEGNRASFVSERRRDSKEVFSALQKMLGAVQRLHVDLSCTPQESSCIAKALDEFKKSFVETQNKISDHTLSLPDITIDKINAVYRIMASLMIDLHTLQASSLCFQAFDLVCERSIQLANEVISVRELLATPEVGLPPFRRENLANMAACCGVRVVANSPAQLLGAQQVVRQSQC